MFENSYTEYSKMNYFIYLSSKPDYPIFCSFGWFLSLFANLISNRFYASLLPSQIGFVFYNFISSWAPQQKEYVVFSYRRMRWLFVVETYYLPHLHPIKNLVTKSIFSKFRYWQVVLYKLHSKSYLSYTIQFSVVDCLQMI